MSGDNVFYGQNVVKDANIDGRDVYISITEHGYIKGINIETFYVQYVD